MPVDIIIGAQWGDEGKGRVTDLMAAEADLVARYSGGDNAGHTVTIGERIFKLHLIPSGVIHDGVACLIGGGVVVNPAVLLEELDGLAERGVDVSPGRLKLSRHAHLITPAHVALDEAKEKARGDDAIGTTLRGIGPAYADKAARTGVRAGLMADPAALRAAIEDHIAAHNQVLENVHGMEPLDAAAVAAQYAAYAERLTPYLVNGTVLIHRELSAGRSILAEGAQGTLLDLDHGTYPFVTSSHPIAGGALVGLGVGPGDVRRVVGVAKSFTTRVGGGPFPTELSGEMAQRLRGTGENPWDEYGTTTGRPRRVGWLDLVILRHARRVNGLTELSLTKLDILSGIDQLQVCVAYDLDGEQITHFPSDLETLSRCRPIYETLPGWEADIMEIREMAALPAAARDYVSFVSETLGTPITTVSVGPARHQIIDNRA
jgi:adenylosuccinate synthase